MYCSNTTDSWANSTTLYNAEYNNEDIYVFAVCKYIIYIPPILNENGKIDICEIEISGKFIFVELEYIYGWFINIKHAAHETWVYSSSKSR